MFIDFFFSLKKQGIPVTPREYLDLLRVLEMKDIDESFSLESFYLIARSCLIKDIKYFDDYDIVFNSCFGTSYGDESFRKDLHSWLDKAKKFELDEERLKNALKIPTEKLMEELKKRLEEQQKRHDGGNKWIGTGGTSPFGNSGFNPEGIRIGGGAGSRSALAVVGERKFKDYRQDLALDIRNIKVALKKLRILSNTGRVELSISKSIQRTCNNAGEIELVYEKNRKNKIKLLLLMDIGGSMTPHSRRVERLFSAAHQINHFKYFKAFYFHNIFYDELYHDGELDYRKASSLESLFNNYHSDTRVIIVGDALMAPYELFQMTGNTMNYYRYLMSDMDVEGQELSAIERCTEFKKHFPNTVWLNPEKQKFWQHPTCSAIRDVFPMYYLSIEGIDQAIKSLI